MKLGDGKESFFWDRMWSGDIALKDKFSKLFILSTKKDGKVVEMGYWKNGGWMWKVEWRRALRDTEKVWEEELVAFLRSVVLLE